MNNLFSSGLLLLLSGARSDGYLLSGSNNHNSGSYGYSNQHHGDCTQLKEYREIHRLLTHDTCISVEKVFLTMSEITTAGFEANCRRSLEQLLAAKYPRGTKTPNNCICTGHNVLLDYEHIYQKTVGFSECRHDSHYMNLYNVFFDDGNNKPLECRTHHTVWYDLYHTGFDSKCQGDLIAHIGSEVRSHHDPCTCHEKPPPTTTRTTLPTTTTTTPTTSTTLPTTTTSTTLPTTTTTTTTSTTLPTTTTSTTVSTTTTATRTPAYTTIHAASYNFQYHCSRASAVLALVNHVVVNSAFSENCTKGGSNDGFVLAECNVTSSISQWRSSLQVRPNCDQIPWYTPIATFYSHDRTYHPAGAMSGIFVGCLSNGFKMIVEHCGDSDGPALIHVEDGGVFVNDPLNYYVIG